MIRTRFAPSPTGSMHLGNLRTAIYNWLYAKNTGGVSLLRIEDTDKERSGEHDKEILEVLEWMQMDYPQTVYQSDNVKSHIKAVEKLIASGAAYECYATSEDVEAHKVQQPDKPFKSPWRNKQNKPNALQNKPCVRLKIPLDTEITYTDAVLGEMSKYSSDLEDPVIMRSDGTPTYNLAAVCDDIAMGITHVIRGADHLTNTFKQIILYNALQAQMPIFAHLPLILDENGAKMSKRNGGFDVKHYKDMGILPEALFNYLLRLGWSLQDQEYFTVQEAIELFTIDNIGKSPSRFDMKKLLHLNSYHIRKKSDNDLLNFKTIEMDAQVAMKAIPLIRERLETLKDIDKELLVFNAYATDIDEKSAAIIKETNVEMIASIIKSLNGLQEWDALKNWCTEFSVQNNIKKGKLMQILRAHVAGTFASIGILDLMEVIGRYETLTRLSRFEQC